MAESGLEFRVYYTPPKSADGTVVICHHGAGWSGLTFAAFAKEVARVGKGECGLLTFDCRAHGLWNVKRTHKHISEESYR